MGRILQRVVGYGLLLLLLGLAWTTHGSLPPGPLRNGAIAALAAAQVAVVAFAFMDLGRSPLLVRIAAAGILCWLAVLFGFTAIDYLHR